MKYREIWGEHAINREGKRLKVYKDTRGFLTVGIGHLVTKEDDLKVGDAISDKLMWEFFRKDSAKAEKAALAQAKESGVTTDQWIAALISVNFQLGIGWRTKFKSTWAAIVAKDYDRAITNLEKSAWMKQTPVRVKDFIKAIRILQNPLNARPLRKTRTVKGATVGAVGVGATAALEVVQETTSQIEPLVPYAETLKFVFLALALVGIGLTIYARMDDRKKGFR